YSLDGAHVLYASDRAGTFNIYAVNRSDGTVRRLTNTLGVALQPQPTPDGRGFVYVDVHLDGQDLYAAALDLEHAPVVGSDDDRTPWSRRVLDTAPPSRASLDDATPYN